MVTPAAEIVKANSPALGLGMKVLLKSSVSGTLI